MPSPDPIDLLEKELAGHKHSLEKSITAYKKGRIDAATHIKHKENLNRLISNYTQAIYLLKLPKK
jgi:hypothetical protein